MIQRPRYDYALDIETLQTDIMRFMAILGFCLMTIFALVQSIPTGTSDVRPRLELKQSIEQQIADLQTTVETLTVKRNQIEFDTVELLGKQDILTEEIIQAEMEKTKSQLSISELQQKRRELANQSKQTQSVLIENKVQLKKIQQDLKIRSTIVEDLVSKSKKHETRLTKLRKKVSRETLNLGSLARQIDVADSKLVKVQQDITAKVSRQTLIDLSLTSLTKKRSQMKQEINKLAVNQQAAKLKSVEKKMKQKLSTKAAIKKPEKRGFSLRFDSDKTLMRLVYQGQVDFYAMTGKNAFRIYNGAFQKALKPSQFHQMTYDTVPGSYRQLLESKFSIYKSSAVTWGVVLPKSIQTKIKNITAKHKGGDLVINSGGLVNLEQ